MKALAWYAVIFNVLIIIALILAITEVIEKPPFSTLEGIAWAVLSLPVIVLGWRIAKKGD